jgi:hypothetical protein
MVNRRKTIRRKHDRARWSILNSIKDDIEKMNGDLLRKVDELEKLRRVIAIELRVWRQHVIGHIEPTVHDWSRLLNLIEELEGLKSVEREGNRQSSKTSKTS